MGGRPSRAADHGRNLEVQAVRHDVSQKRSSTHGNLLRAWRVPGRTPALGIRISVATKSSRLGVTEVLKRRTDPWKDIGKAADQILPVAQLACEDSGENCCKRLPC
jgi:hypothetical protein